MSTLISHYDLVVGRTGTDSKRITELVANQRFATAGVHLRAFEGIRAVSLVGSQENGTLSGAVYSSGAILVEVVIGIAARGL